jgi:AAA domain/TIR domain
MLTPEESAEPTAEKANPYWSPDLFIGRNSDVARIEKLLREGRSALLVGGRRAGKTTLVRQLSEQRIKRSLVLTDVGSWDLTSEATGLGALRGALAGVPVTDHEEATRSEVTRLLEEACPVAVVIDEADQLLTTTWGPRFFAFLRWLDDKHLRGSISIVLVGGPVLVLFHDPEDRGSPPLNTAETRYVYPLDGDAVLELANLGRQADHHDEILTLCGGHAWLTTLFLAEMWLGASLEEAADITFDTALAAFPVWRRQLGPKGRDLLRRLPSSGISRNDLKQRKWSGFHEAVVFGQCVGVIRRDSGLIIRGPQLFMDWFGNEDDFELAWDIAISYASEDEPLARQLHNNLRDEFKVFFAPEEDAGLWGTDLTKVLPNIYGVQSEHVLVLSTPAYVAKHWTRVEYEAVASRTPGKILLLDHGALPKDIPPGLVYRGSSPGQLVGLIPALRKKLSAGKSGYGSLGLG